MNNRKEYIIALLFWIPMSIVCFICVVPGFSEIVPFTFNVFDLIVLILITIFGIIRILLSIIQFNSRRFYGRGDLYDIYSGLLMMILIPTLLLLGHIEMILFPVSNKPIIVIFIVFLSFLLFVSIVLRALRKYIRNRKLMKQYFERLRNL